MAAATLGFGTVMMISMLRTFLAHERYRRPPKPLGPVEFAQARREAEAKTMGAVAGRRAGGSD